jgi:gamma-glutamyl:cysteine ligase YbdK (ATP-grasp superfamily)
MPEEASDPVDRLKTSKQLDVDAFEQRVREEAAVIEENLAAGTFDNDQVTVGLEYEFYAVDEGSAHIRRVPRALLHTLGFDKELGLHNAELNASVQPCNRAGIEAIAKEVEAKLSALHARAADDDIRFVSDGMWTTGPEHDTADDYLTEATHEEGLTLGINVSNAVRYHAFGSMDGNQAIGGRVDLPGATIEADSAEPVSLTTSIQPHYQPLRAADLPAVHGIALRLAGPLLAVAVNSPFLPPELYDDDALTRDLVTTDAYAENRIPVYEGMMNPADGPAKVRFSRDIETPADAIERVVEDAVLVPAEIGAGERFDDAFVHFRHKHGSYWRWVRPVFDGASKADASARIEFRPLPGQPTVADTISLVAAFVGATTELHETDHPVRDLPWADARDNFYAAVRDGLNAELAWVTTDGDRTTDVDRLYADLFDAATAGLERHGLDRQHAAHWLQPLRRRVDRRLTPAAWKRDVAVAAMDDGLDAPDAIRETQRRYVDCQRETLFDGHLVDWPAP